jgi:hypothetical protein
MNIVWAQAAIYEPPEVLGKTLQGFAPFHALMLEAVQSPFMRGGYGDFDDIILAVHICSHSWAARASILSASQELVEWGKTCTAGDISSAREKLESYFSESWKMPQFWPTDGGTMRANWIYHLVVFGMRYLRMPESRAWDCPISRLVCYRACVGETDGDKSLMSEDEIKGIEVLKADAEREKANGAS